MTMLPLTQDVTYWTVVSKDGRGQTTYSTGVKIKGRWVDKDGIVRDAKGEDRNATFIVYSTVFIPRGSLVALGNFEGQSVTISGDKREIISTIKNTSISDLIKHVG